MVEHCTGIVEVTGSNPVEASDIYFWAFFATPLVASYNCKVHDTFTTIVGSVCNGFCVI